MTPVIALVYIIVIRVMARRADLPADWLWRKDYEREAIVLLAKAAAVTAAVCWPVGWVVGRW